MTDEQKDSKNLQNSERVLGIRGDRGRLWNALSLTTRLVIGAVLVLSGMPKLMDPGRFYQQVMGFGLVDSAIAAVVVYAVPILELMIAGCLFFGLLLGGAWAITATLMAGFTFLHLRVVVLGQEVTCGCFDPHGTQLIGWWTVSRNAILLLVSTVGLAIFLWARPSSPRLDRPTRNNESDAPLISASRSTEVAESPHDQFG